MTAQATIAQFGGATQGNTQDLDSGLVAAGAGSLMYGGISGGAANAQTITVPNRITVPIDGYTFSFISGFNNTAPATLQITGGSGGILSILNLCDQDGVPLVSGAIVAGRRYSFQVCTVSGNTHLRQM